MFFRLSAPSSSKARSSRPRTWSRTDRVDTDAARRTLSLKSGRDIHHISVDVSAIRDHIADVDADTKADSSIGGLVTVVDRYLLLNLHGTAHRSVDAVEHNEQRIAARLDDPAAMLINRGIDNLSA